MSITVTVLGTCKVFETVASSNRELNEAVESILRNASNVAGVPLATDHIRFTDSNEEVPTVQRTLGSRDITVTTKPAITINALLSSMQRMESSLAVALELHIRNTAAQILLHAVGQAEFREEPTECDYFTKLGASHAGICRTAQKMGVQPGKFVWQADAVITRRNAYFHPLTLAALEEEVGKLQPEISTDLRRLCKWECDVVANYQVFKEAFPDCFKSK